MAPLLRPLRNSVPRRRGGKRPPAVFPHPRVNVTARRPGRVLRSGRSSADLRFSCSSDCRRLISASGEGTPPNCGPRRREERRETGCRMPHHGSLVFRVVPSSTNRKGAANVDAHPNGLQLSRRHPAARDPTKDGTSSKGRQWPNGGTATPSCRREPAPPCPTGAAQLVGAGAFEPVTCDGERSFTESIPVPRFYGSRRDDLTGRDGAQ